MVFVAPARAEDLRDVQLQLGNLSERVDFFIGAASPPLANLMQDYVQGVEHEASVQMSRLKRVPFLRPFLSGSAADASDPQIEMVKWLRFVTDMIMALDPSVVSLAKDLRRPPAKDPEPGMPATPRPRLSEPLSNRGLERDRLLPTGWPHLEEAKFEEPGLATPGLDIGRLSAERMRPEVGEGRMQALASTGLSDFGDSTDEGLDEDEPVLCASLSQSRPFGEAERQRVARCAAIGLLNERRMSDPSSDLRQEAQGPKEANRRSSLPANCFSESFPGAGGPGLAAECEDGAGEHSLGGLVLGRGDWALAYRESQGARRNAFRLLSMSGIVTARELEDDLTVVSQEHIDECAVIATEMLQTWPLDVWAQQPAKAKQVFERKLTALYHRKTVV